jgi:serine/threonine protein kinase
MAPEVIKSTQYDFKCDVFSFGIIMFQILTQCEDKQIYPENKLNGNNIEYNLASNPNFRPEVTDQLNSNKEYSEYIVLMKSCWDYYAYNRPEFIEISKKLGNLLLN